jgi:hypothetical protein
MALRSIGWCLALIGAVAAVCPAAATETLSRSRLYFDANVVGGTTVTFKPNVALPPIESYVPPGAWSYDTRKPAKLSDPYLRPGETRPAWNVKSDDDSFGRVLLNGGTFGLETERHFNTDKSIPSSQLLDSTIERHSKKPFIGLSIEAPYESEAR